MIIGSSPRPSHAYRRERKTKVQGIAIAIAGERERLRNEISLRVFKLVLVREKTVRVSGKRLAMELRKQVRNPKLGFVLRN